MGVRNVLLGGVQTRAAVEAARWLDDAIELAGRTDQERLLDLYTSASRRLGRQPLNLTPTAGFPPQEAAGLSVDKWSLEDAARVLLLLTRAEAVPAEEFAADAVACFEQGDAREQQSWLRGVALLPAADRFRPLVIDACRSNILPVFEAVACENPYPSRYFPDLNFNQVVMKALFNGVSLARIVGLNTRTNAELARMAGDFAAERRAAGRAVPADIGLAMTGAAA